MTRRTACVVQEGRFHAGRATRFGIIGITAASLIVSVTVPCFATEATVPSANLRSLPELLRAESSILDALDSAVFEARRAESVMNSAASEQKAAEARMASAETALMQARMLEHGARARLQATLRLHRTAEPFGSAAVLVLLGGDEELSRRTTLLARLSKQQATDVATITASTSGSATACLKSATARPTLASFTNSSARDKLVSQATASFEPAGKPASRFFPINPQPMMA